VLLSLAAGTVLDATPEQAVDAAAEAGFDAVGLRFAEPPGERRLAELGSRVAASGLCVLDVEVVRLGPRPASDFAWLVDAAGALGARFLLSVIECDDLGWTRRELAALCDRAAPLGVTVAVEHMLFTAVRRLPDAHALIQATGCENAAVLVDLLHLARAGDDVALLRGPAGGRVGYVQICDAPAAGPTSDAALQEEARHHRLMPGEGDLPVRSFLDAAGGVPVSVEVQSDDLAARCAPVDRARHAMRATRALLRDDRFPEQES
jgi:sugar phosphate isomerase/epimerase